MLKFKELIRALSKALIIIICLWLIFILITKTLQNSAMLQIAELTKTRIEAHSVDFALNGSVLIKKLVIRPDREPGYDDAILRAEKTYARFGLVSLLLLRPKLKEIRLYDFVFNAQYDLDTNLWNVTELKIPPPRAGTGKMPTVILSNGKLQYAKVAQTRSKVIASVPIDAKFGPNKKVRDAYSFSITTAEKPGGGQSNLKGIWGQGYIYVNGGMSSTDLPAFEKAWSIEDLDLKLFYDLRRNYALRLKAKNLNSKQDLSLREAVITRPKFLEKFGAFKTLQDFFSNYQPAGLIDLNIEATGDLNELSESQLTGKVYCRDVSICEKGLPYMVEGITGWIDFTQDSVLLNNLYGRHKNIELFFNGFSKGFDADQHYRFRITSSSMPLDKDLYESLSERQKKIWSAFSPSGTAAIDYRLVRTSPTEKKESLSLELLDGNALYYDFPYPLKNLKGTIVFEPEKITISNLVSKWNGRKINIDGQVTEPDAERSSWQIIVKANNIPLDATLLAALPEREAQFFEVLGQKGDIDIEDLSGDFFNTKTSENTCYNIKLKSGQVELNENLFSLIPSKFRQKLSQSKPQGKVVLDVELANPEGRDLPDYKVTVNCLNDRIRPEQMHFGLKDLTGKLMITKEDIRLQDICATVAGQPEEPNKATIRISGLINTRDEELLLEKLNLSANNLALDEKVCRLLPNNIRPLYTKIGPAGRIDIELEDITENKETAKDKQCIDLYCKARLKDCDFHTCPAVRDIDATLTVKGQYQKGLGFSGSDFTLCADNLRIKDKLLTNLKANLCYKTDEQSLVAQNFIADSYDGKVTGRFRLDLPEDAVSNYSLQIGFRDIDLNKFLKDSTTFRNSNNEHTTGKMKGSLCLSSALEDESRCVGRCRLVINQMKIGSLSPLAKLLTVLKLTEPDNYAFEQMLVDSYLNHNRLLVNKFDLSGPRVAFNGSGTLDFESENIDLRLTARGERLATDEPSLLQSLTEGLGHAVVRMDVRGNYQDPNVTTTTLPVLERTLEILGTKSPK
jgi:hypothetical protein